MFNLLLFPFGGYSAAYVPRYYIIAGHPLLSPAARRLASDTLYAQAEVAESLLGLDGTEFGGNYYRQAVTAIVLQVNFQVEAGTDIAVYASKGRGARSVTYRETALHPTAIGIANAILTAHGIGGYGVLLSRRPISG